MSVPVLPPPFDQIGHRRFSLYPAIVGIEHNEWVLRKAAWSEVMIANTKTDLEVWVPRRFVGEVSRTDEPVMILGLTKEVEYRAGQIIPHVRRVIEMPKAVNESYRPPTGNPEPTAAPVVGIRLESGAERRIGRLILWALGGGVLVCLIVIFMFRTDSNPRIRYNPVLQSDLGLTRTDDYHSVVRKLGTPSADDWKSHEGDMRFRIMKYPDRRISVILMGPEEDTAQYIGSVDDGWRVVDTVTLPGGSSTGAMLRSLKPR
jgi:hypothetical protein